MAQRQGRDISREPRFERMEKKWEKGSYSGCFHAQKHSSAKTLAQCVHWHAYQGELNPLANKWNSFVQKREDAGSTQRGAECSSTLY